MDFLISSAYAQTAGAAQGQPPSFLLLFGYMAVALVIMYFFMIRPQSRRAKEQRTLIDGLAKGDEIVLNGGLTGRVEDIGETFIGVEIAPGVSVKVQKQAVTMVLPKGTLKSA